MPPPGLQSHLVHQFPASGSEGRGCGGQGAACRGIQTLWQGAGTMGARLLGQHGAPCPWQAAALPRAAGLGQGPVKQQRG